VTGGHAPDTSANLLQLAAEIGDGEVALDEVAELRLQLNSFSFFSSLTVCGAPAVTAGGC